MRFKKAVSPILATIILIAVVVSAGLVVYATISGLFGRSGATHAFEVINTDLLKSSIGGVLSITVKNTGSTSVALVKVSMIADDGSVVYVTGSLKKFYLIYIDGIGGWWVNPWEFYNGCMSVLSSAQATATRVLTLSELDDLVRNPPEGAVVINCHGELVPRPATWDSWQSYYLAIAENVKSRGWIFVTARGYPLFYTQLEGVGSVGLNTFLSSVGASADAWGFTSHSTTPEGREALSMFSITPADPLSGVRTVAWSSIAPSSRFYAESGGRDLAAAVKMGGGFYLNAETSQLPDYEAARYASAFAYWLADKIQIEPGQASSLTVMGLQVTAGKTYTVVVMVRRSDGSMSSRTFAVKCA